jgi:Secretion system C-terminal sorting domain
MKKLYIALASCAFVMANAFAQTSPISIKITTTDNYGNGSCNGTATGVFSGGLPPYSYFGVKWDSDITLYNLCPGSYSYYGIKDAANNSIDTSFIIGPTDSTYYYGAPISPTVDIVGLVLKSVSNCKISYDSIDSIKITDHHIVGNDSVNVTWSIYEPKKTNTQNVTYPFDSSGIHTLMLDLHCDLRSTSSTAKAIDHLDLTKNATGIDINHISDVTVFPNPSSGFITIKSISAGTYSLVSGSGHLIQAFQLNSGNQYTIKIENLNSGIYYIVGENNHIITHKKVVVIR